MSAAHQVISDWDNRIVLILLFVNIGVNLWRRYAKGDVSDSLRYHLYAAALWLVAGIIDFVNQDWVGMWLCALFMADELRGWWKNGGGKNTKRRLKKLKEKFVAKRRTAPQTA